MADVSFLIASSPSPPLRRRLHHRSPPPPPAPPPKPFLSDVRRDLSSATTSTSSSVATTSSARNLLKYYARLASKLARDGKFRDFLMIAESVLTSDAVAADAPQFVARVDPRMVSRGLFSLLQAGDLDGVLAFVRESERLGFCPASLFDEAALEALGAECRRQLLDAGRLENFVALMENLAGYRFVIKDIVDPADVLSKIVDKRNPELAIRYASVFPHSQLLFCSIMEEFGKKRDLTSAIKSFEAFKQRSGGINMFACRAIIDVCGSCGDYLKSRIIFEDLLAEKISLNIYVINSLMNVNAHDLSYNLGVFSHMQNLGITADLTSYNILLKSCCHAKHVDMAQEIFEKMKYMASKGKLKLDVFTYSTMIKVFADAKMWQMALSIKEEMLSANVSPNIVTWSALISAFANAGLVDNAIRMFEEMLMNSCEPNAQCCNIILDACVESCQYDRAFRLFCLWKESGFKMSSTTCRRRDQKGVTSEKESPPPMVKVIPFKPTISTFNILMKACGTDFHRAKALMNEMKTLGFVPNRISWSVLIDVYGAAQNVKGVMQALRSMRDTGVKLDVIAYTTAIKACVENNNFKIAFSLFEEMKRFQIQPNLVTYNTLLKARSKYGSLQEVQQCLIIYQDMRKAGYSPNDYYLKQLIEEWCEGILCSRNNDQEQIEFDNYTKKEQRKPCNLLLEKVAIHLQKDIGDSQAIDIRGLTKVEARIVVLSVLRMIKESCTLGKSIEDDVIIMTEVERVASPASRELDVQYAISKLLQDELGLDVRSGHGSRDESVNSATNLQTSQVQPRRPQDLGVLKVTKESLLGWLQKKCGQSQPA